MEVKCVVVEDEVGHHQHQDIRVVSPGVTPRSGAPGEIVEVTVKCVVEDEVGHHQHQDIRVVSPGVTPRSGAPGEGEGRGGEEGEASVDVEESLFEAKDVLQKIPKSLVWNFMRYVITN